MSADVDIAPGLRTAILANDAIAPLLSVWNGEPAVFTRRPVPSQAKYPMIVINPDASISDVDGLVARRPMVRRDIVVYGEQPNDYRTVEQIGYALRTQFHSKRFALQVDGYETIEIVVAGPRAAPVDSDTQVARAILATVKLEDLAP